MLVTAGCCRNLLSGSLDAVNFAKRYSQVWFCFALLISWNHPLRALLSLSCHCIPLGAERSPFAGHPLQLDTTDLQKGLLQ